MACGLAAYPFTVASSLPISVANILEWQVMPFNLVGGKIFLVLVLGFFLAQMTFRFSWHVFEILLFLFGHGDGLPARAFSAAFRAIFRAAVGHGIWRAGRPHITKSKDQVPDQFRADGGQS